MHPTRDAYKFTFPCNGNWPDHGFQEIHNDNAGHCTYQGPNGWYEEARVWSIRGSEQGGFENRCVSSVKNSARKEVGRIERHYPLSGPNFWGKFTPNT